MAPDAVKERHDAALRSLHPIFRWRVELVLSDLEAKGWQPILVFGKRSAKTQKELIKKGYGARFSWHVPGSVKILPDGSGFHVVHGNAADIVDRRWAWSGPCENKNHPFWQDLGRAAKRRGLEWGGAWSNRDVAHVQMKFIEMRKMESVVT